MFKQFNGSGSNGKHSFRMENESFNDLLFFQGSTSKASTAKKSSVRCHNCKKKIGIACRYQCRCGLTFCSVHRYPEAHNCTFDYKTEGRNKLRENNPVIVAQKIQEI